MDDSVIVFAETIVPAGRFIRIQATAPRSGVFFCTHAGIEIFARRISGGKVDLTAMAMPGNNHVRLAVGEKVGVVDPGNKISAQPKPSRVEVSGNGKEKH